LISLLKIYFYLYKIYLLLFILIFHIFKTKVIRGPINQEYEGMKANLAKFYSKQEFSEEEIKKLVQKYYKMHNSTNSRLLQIGASLTKKQLEELRLKLDDK